jgi:adenylate cyclase
MAAVEELTATELARRCGCMPGEIERYAALGTLSRPQEPFGPGDVTRVRLLQALERSGVVPEDVGRAIASGEFSFAAVEALLPKPASAALSDMTFEELCRQFGFSMQFVQDVYAGLGLPQPSPIDLIRQDDLEMAPILQAIRAIPMTGEEGAILHATRFWGENLHRLALAETRFFETYVLAPLLRSGLPEHRMLEIALPQGALAQELDERVLVWLHGRHVEQALMEQVLGHLETALERAGAIRRRPRDLPAIGFLDLSGFTALTESQGDEAAVELTVGLAELVRSASRRHDGQPVKFLGDGVMCHFQRPADAVVAALEMVEEAPSAGLPPARVGLHAGPVIARDGDYFGRTVNIASRIVGVAGPNEVLVTEDLRGMAEPEGVLFDPVGDVELKGIASPVPLHQARRT